MGNSGTGMTAIRQVTPSTSAFGTEIDAGDNHTTDLGYPCRLSTARGLTGAGRVHGISAGTRARYAS